MTKEKFTIWFKDRAEDDGPACMSLTETECFEQIATLWKKYQVSFEELEIKKGVDIGSKFEESEPDCCPNCGAPLSVIPMGDDMIEMVCDFCINGFAKYILHVSEQKEYAEIRRKAGI